ncbi:MAG TPA: AraC family transcriptional regulator [Gemmatimonadaceae bacterium]|nr:AraC family transcriptional regulator [Gemmatimonadaceae bacterium]
MSTSASAVGSFVSWSGGCLFIGRAAVLVPVHAHYAIQLAFGFEHGIGFRTGEPEPWTRYGGAMIPSRQPHSMDATTVSGNAVMFVEPETREGRVLHERYLETGIAEMPPEALAVTQRIVAAWLTGDRQSIVASSMALINTLTGGVEPTAPSDERVLRAIAYINSHLDGKLTLEEVAEQAFLSPSRFRHLFVEETGMALRPYILWRRFLKVWELSMEGQSLSAVAHAAGFADAAHLSRTSRRMFGLTPSMLRTNRPPLVATE